MATQTLIQAALLGLFMVHSAASQSCSIPFDATFVLVTDVVVPASEYQFRDPQLRFYTEIMRFTAEEIDQVMRNAMQHFNSQFGLDFSNIEPDDTNQRFLGNAAFGPYRVPFNETIVTNHWIVTGNRRSRCFPMSSGSWGVSFNGTTMLHGLHGGNAGRPVNAGDYLLYGHFMIFDACAQQPILIQTQTDVPARVLPVEGWVVEELRLYNRYLGRGRIQSVFKATTSPDGPTMIVAENQRVVSFP